ncbi:MAG: hypothetical protein K0S67_459, partial [Nitrososphaeraceae archaeon]|nr:hypothetical protein [Nitrososphaeraceae archaeon]
DIETGPDGFLYVLTHDRETGDGNLYRIVLGASGAPDTTTPPPIIEETPPEEDEEDEEDEE